MDQQVSPAVVVIVLILIAAILVGLYFLVVERRPQMSAEEDPAMDMAPMGDEMMSEPDGAGDAAVEAEAQGDQDQGDADDEQADTSDEGEADEADAVDDEGGGGSAQ